MSALFALDDFSRRPYRDMHAGFVHALQRFTTWPAPEEYDALTRHVPQAADVLLPRFVTEDRAKLRQVGGYEQHVAQLCAVPTRPGSWHDFFNMSVWAHFPKVRWALNALHVSTDVGPKDPRNGRAPAQNLAATFDEAGLIVVSSSTSILEELRGLRFKQAFWARRDELLATTRFWVVGHGMLEALLEPHPGMSARSLLLHVPTLPLEGPSEPFRFALDALVAERIHSWRQHRAVLDPIPVLAIPGFSANDCAAFYEDMRNIRYEPRSRRPPDNMER